MRRPSEGGKADWILAPMTRKIRDTVDDGSNLDRTIFTGFRAVPVFNIRRSTITVTQPYVEEIEDPVTGQLQVFKAATEAELERLDANAVPQDEVGHLAPDDGQNAPSQVGVID